MPHQRNIYKGEPARAWLRLQLNRRDGHSVEREFLVDTGNPCALIVSEAMLWVSYDHIGFRVVVVQL